MEILINYLHCIHELSPALREHLSSILKIKSYYKKEFILKAGHVSRNIYFIRKGLVRSFYIKHDTEISGWFMKEGDVIVSVESFFRQTGSNESIQAIEDTELFYIGYDELQFIYRHFPEFNYTGRVLTEKYYTMSEQRLFAMRMQRATERYDYMVQYEPDLIRRVPGKDIATYLGITEETLSRIRTSNY